MEALTWTGTAGNVLLPVLQIALIVLALALIAKLLLTLAGANGPGLPDADGTITGRSPGEYAGLTIRYSFLAALLSIVGMLAAGAVMPSPVEAGIFGAMAVRLWPIWLALIATFVLSIRFRRRLGLYGKLFDSTVGMIGFAIVMFWVFTAIFADVIITHDPLAQIAGLKNDPSGSAADSAYAWYLLGGDHLGRDVFSRMVMGAREVLKIAPAATLFAFMVGITLGLPAGYFGGRLDTIISFFANLVLAFPVILLFYLLVTPEIRVTGIPIVLAAVLFIFPIIFLCILWNSRYHTDKTKRNLYVGLTLLLGLWAYSGLAFNMDPLGVWSMEPNMLNVFVSVVFVNSPGVFRIVRGLVMDIKARDYVAAGQTRGEGPWYIMLWEILPNARGPLIVDFCLRIGYTTILLGTLGFFGLGVSPDSPDWGSTIDDGRKLLNLFPHPAVVPALALMSLVLGLNLLADGLREESLKD
ncbi:ABC transporter permease [Tabrizicola sp.]|uniref:ABC transporter permease n=1 Tax=Tabrizicola sp. TaxID=2005166 RepID=UPI003F2E3FA7